MADGERGRGGFRRRRFYSNRERDKERFGRGRDRFYYDRKEQKYAKEEEKEVKHLVILTKPKPEGEKEVPGEPVPQPTILLKPREGESRTVSPNPPSSPMTTRQNESTAANPNYQIATKSPAPPNMNRLLLNETKMTHSVRLLDGGGIKDNILSFLTDHTDYLVVGCLGPASVGKSFFLSRLVNHHRKSRNVFDVQDSKKSSTSGEFLDKIDVYITEGRVIFLDSSAISSSALAKLDKKNSEEVRLYENELELLSYQYVALLLSVCHIVCCIMDRTTDDNLLKFLLTVEVLKPVTTTQNPEGDEVIEYSPQLLLIQNRCQSDDYSCKNLKILQESYRNTLKSSKLHVDSGLGITNGQVLPTLNPEICQSEPMNVFLLPVLESRAELKNLDKFRGHLGYHKLMSKLRQQIFAAEPMPLTHSTLSEKNWYHYVVKIWDNIKKNSNLSDYSRPCPSWSILKERNIYGKT